MPETLDQNIGTSYDKYFALLITALFGGVLYYAFDFRVDSGGDNAAYILRAYRLVNDGIFPSYQGPLYPLILSPIIYFFGVDIIVLKAISGTALLISHYFIFLAFRGSVKPLAILGMLTILIFTNEYVFYGSETYSEGVFILFQSIYLLLLFRVFSKDTAAKSTRGKVIFEYLVLAFCCLILGLTRSIGFSSMLATALFLLLRKNPYSLSIFCISFLVLYFLYKLSLTFWIAGGDDQLLSQPTQLLLKDPYNPQLGQEDVGGLLLRFWENSCYYFGEAIPSLIGFKKISDLPVLVNTFSVWAMILVYGIYGYVKKNDTALFLAIYCVLTFFLEFSLLHSFWKQVRLIIPYYPILLLILVHSICLVVAHYVVNGRNKLEWLTAGAVSLIIILSSSSMSVKRYYENYKFGELHKAGLKYAGYTEAWRNYFKMSEYVGNNISQNDVVVSRKPALSFLFGKRKFEGFYRFPYSQLSEFSNLNAIILRSKDYLQLTGFAKIDVLQDRLIGIFYSNKSKAAHDFYKSGEAYVIIGLEDWQFKSFNHFLERNGYKYKTSLHAHLDHLEEVSYVNIDNLLDNLIRRKVKYLISENFDTRDNYSSLVDKLGLFINLKYPSLINKIHSIGDEYTVELYEVDYLKLLQYKGIVEK